MKKWIYAVILAVLLSMDVVFPAMAEGDMETNPPVRLTDEANLLTDSEEAQLRAELDEISERQNLDVVIVTANSLGGKTSTAYADDFYDDHGYGMGPDKDGILLLVSMEERDWAICTSGYGITVFTDARQEDMVDEFLPYLSDGEYVKAFRTYAEQCDKWITRTKESAGDHAAKSPFRIFVDLGIGLVLAFIMAFFKRSKLKSVKRRMEAEGYMGAGGLRLTRQEDRFLNRLVTRRHIEPPKSSGSGGSSTHMSSSGHTHGGSHGKF